MFTPAGCITVRVLYEKIEEDNTCNVSLLMQSIEFVAGRFTAIEESVLLLLLLLASIGEGLLLLLLVNIRKDYIVNSKLGLL